MGCVFIPVGNGKLSLEAFFILPNLLLILGKFFCSCTCILRGLFNHLRFNLIQARERIKPSGTYNLRRQWQSPASGVLLIAYQFSDQIYLGRTNRNDRCDVVTVRNLRRSIALCTHVYDFRSVDADFPGQYHWPPDRWSTLHCFDVFFHTALEGCSLSLYIPKARLLVRRHSTSDKPFTLTTLSLPEKPASPV